MGAAVVIALHAAVHPVIFPEMTDLRIVHLVTIMVVGHECVHISLIVIQIHRGRMAVVGREIIPVPGRMPWNVCGTAEVGEYGRACDEYRTHIIMRAINERSSYYFKMVCSQVGVLDNKRGDILENVSSKHCLNDKKVIVPLVSLNDTEIIYVSVTVEVKVRNHVSIVVDKGFELPDIGGLCERRPYGLQVKVE